jgi:hypothetical protein
MIRRAALAALGVSVLLHGLLLGGARLMPGPAIEPVLPEPLVQVRMIAPPPASKPPVTALTPPVSRAEPRPAPRPAPVVVQPTAMLQPQTLTDAVPASQSAEVDVAAEVALQPAAPVVAEPAPPAELAAGPQLAIEGWPERGNIVFRVLMGEKGFEVGQAEHQWSHDEHHYRMELVLRTTGLAALMRNFHYVQRSEGELGPLGLKPQHFKVEQSGKRPESAEFDWGAGRVSLRRDGVERRSAAVRAGDQDVLSLWHQIGIVGTSALPQTLTVVSNKGAKPARLEAVGHETVRLPIGRLDTLRLRVQATDGSLTIDIWLARHYGLLPVRIRIVDDKEEVLDQQAIQLRLTPPDGVAEDEAALVHAQAPDAPDMIELKEAPRPAEPVAGLYQN